MDNCIGSGTTAVACIMEGRNYIGIEKWDKMYLKATKRVKETELVESSNMFSTPQQIVNKQQQQQMF